MSRKSIHPTNHAVERFEQRVLPQLPKSQQIIMQKKERILHSLYKITQSIDIEEENNIVVHVNAFFTFKGYPPIPLTLVINPLRKVLFTLYISPSWENIGSPEYPIWRFCL